MSDGVEYRVLLFPSVNHALKAEKILKAAGMPYKLIPVPRHLSSDCGICLRIQTGTRDDVLVLLKGKVSWESEAPLDP